MRIMQRTIAALTTVVLLLTAGLARAQTPAALSPARSSAAQTPPEGMVLIPAGDFLMGTDQTDGTDNNQANNTPLSNNDARPQHTATTKAFFLDKNDVTNAQYKAFCDETGITPPPQWKNGQFPEGQDNFPVTRVNWYEARAYATWAGKRLPTETEWEHAARGTDGRAYAWGGEWDDSKAAWNGSPIAVGSKPAGASPYGALDMAGNVAQWTSSWFDAYAGSPVKQPDFGQKTLKVVRGGPGYGGNNQAQTFYREVCKPDSRNMWVGFRCAKDISSAE